MGSDCCKICFDKDSEVGEVTAGDYQELSKIQNQGAIQTSDHHDLDESEAANISNFKDDLFPHSDKSLLGKAFRSKDKKLATLM